MNKKEVVKKMGKIHFYDDEYTLANVLNYESGSSEFDNALKDTTLKQLNAAIHLTKYPKGFVFEIAKMFSIICYAAIPYADIKKVKLLERKNFSQLLFQTTTGEVVFSLKTSNISEVRRYFKIVEIKYLDEQGDFKIKDHADKPANTKKHGVPALFSFFIPGLGQLIKGQILKALLIWVFGGIIGFFLLPTIIIPFVFWAWNVYDAYNSN